MNKKKNSIEVGSNNPTFKLAIALTALASIFGGPLEVRAETITSQVVQNRPNIAPLPKVMSTRVYVLDCGQLIYNHPESYNLTRDEVADTNMPVTCYLVINPKGILLFDTGLSEKLIGRPVYENSIDGYGQIVTKTLRGQLLDIGVTPQDINFIAISHSHFDHVGNVNDFSSSTWLTNKAEFDFMFKTQPRAADFDEFSALEHSKKTVYEGDYDVFGDGNVVLKQTPGHTPGHQSLYLKLKNSGGVVISGDLYHYDEERTKNQMPTKELKSGTPESRKAMEDFLKQTNSKLWIGHSTSFVRDVMKSPAWYE